MSNFSEHKVACVTGSTHGIGKVIVLELAKIGFNVVINGATTKSLPEIYLSELKEIYGKQFEERYIFIQSDVSKADDRSKLVNLIKGKFNRIDVLVNNAGVGPTKREDLLNMTEESYDRVMDINLKGPVFLTQSIAN